MTTQPDLIPWPAFLQMAAAEIEATFGTEASRATVEIAKDVRLMTEEKETREEIKTA